MDDDFDDQYADELDAMEDFNDVQAVTMSPKPRRSLNFTTPKQKINASSSHSSLSPGLSSPLPEVNGSLIGRSSAIDKAQSGSHQKRKISKALNGDCDSDLEYDDEDLTPASAPVLKRTKLSEQVDEDELWGDDLGLAPKHKNLLGSKVKPAVVEVDGMDAPPSPDRRVMEKILEHRNRYQTREIPGQPEPTRAEQLLNEHDFERVRVFRRIPAEAYLATTGSCGNRVYMHLRDDTALNKQFETVGKLTGSQLLSVSISDLRQQLEEERTAKLLAQTERLSDDIHRQMEEGFQDDGDDEDKENQVPLPELPTEPQRLLWVEKYAPYRYTDLLSDESINRSLLHWLKMWDYVVFNKELVVKSKDKKKEEPKKFKKKNEPEILEELDKNKTPLQKVALLCGPPGLGKTTLAHIIAKHASYNVVEMNASDDRSAETFKNKIEASTQMKAVMGADPKPNCLIIDEIDGAPQAAINVLLNLIRKSDGADPGGKKKKKDDVGPLRRPIICICNDQYVPALRQLRQIAMVLNFPQTDPTKLAARLNEVVRSERLKSDLNTLLALCEKTDNDIRSCLNTLQFIQRQCKELNMKNVQAASVGQKDSHKTLFSVWYEILSLPKPKRQKFVNLQESSARDAVLNTSHAARYNQVLSVVQGAGEYDKVTQGLFENYLDCRFKDPHMEGVTMATEWLCFTDCVNEYIQHVQDYRLMPYLPYIAVTFHFLFAANIPPKIKYPSSQSECYQKRMKCENLVSCMMADMSPGTRKFINIPVIIMDIMPPLLDIIQPSFRPVNTQLYSNKEKEDLAQLVRVMIAYNMTYQQEKMPEGQYTYVLEPHVDEVAKFPGMKQHRQLSYASKQLVAREVELEKMRRSERARGPPQPPSENTTATPGKKGDGAPVVPNHLQRLSAKPIGKEEDTQLKDFFGRVIKKVSPETRRKKGSDDPVKTNVLATDIWFHFQEGYSNAVRRTVRVKDFF